MDGATVFLKSQEIQKLVSKMAVDIDKEYKNKNAPLILIAVLKGSLFFLSDLIRRMETPVLVDFVLIEKVGKNFAISKDISLPIKDRHVLIVKEVLNAGRKLSFLKNRLLAGNPESVKMATLLDKPSQRSFDFQPDFLGLSIDDRYIFGCGMDHEEHYRQLEDIYHFTQ